MAKFDKTFPTLDCAACILTPKMSEVGAHPNITLWTYSEVTKVDGYVGNYNVTVKRKPRYINEDLCTGCQECIAHCVFKEPKFPDEFNEGLGKRKPVYIPFPQATPQVVLIDPEVCLNFKRGHGRRRPTSARRPASRPAARRRPSISRRRRARRRSRSAPSSWPPASRPSTPSASRSTATAPIPNVYTALEVERLVNASGPTGGDVVLRDGKQPKAHRHHPLRRLARQEDQPLVLARLLHVFHEARPPAQGAHRRRDLQLLHRHAHARARATRSSTTSCSKKASTSSAAASAKSPTGPSPRKRKASWSSASRTRWPASCGASRWTWWCWPPAWSRRPTPRTCGACST